MYGFSTGFLQVHYDVLAKGLQEPVQLLYGYHTVTVRCMYGSYGACASTVRTCMCLRTPVRSLYVARAGPGDGRECTCWFLAPYDCPRAYYGGGGGICACTTFRHGLLTGMWGLCGLKKPCNSVRARAGPYGMPYDHPRVTGILALMGERKLPGRSM